MERSFYNEDFEELLKQKADQYKMYPSDKVWKGINGSLHSKRKWYWIGFALLFTSMGYYGLETLLAPSKTTNKNIPSGQQPSDQNAADKKVVETPSASALLIPFSASSNRDAAIHGSDAQQTMAGPVSIAAGPGTTTGIAATIQPIEEDDVPPGAKIIELYSSFRPVKHEMEARNATAESDLRFATPGFNRENGHLPVSSFAGEHVETADGEKMATEMTQTSEAAGDERRINWLQEFALHELTIPRTKRVSFLIAFSPTMNFRKLTGNSNAHLPSDVKNVPMALNIEGDLNKLVNHKPALGFELGSHLLYAINKDVTVKAGLQFNYSRYEIQAFSTYRSDVATIALSSTTHRVDSLHSLTRISNFGGDVSEAIQNQYYQLSAPVGLEYRLLGNKRLQIFLAGTIQPTYLINKNSYLITTDYKNYTREPSLVRRWNINTSAEAFVSYKAGGVRWQVGPQFRYQMLSSYSNEYPIKEYLIEYGLKIGVSKTIR